ncbi:MAG: type II toxin-antitoxin system CcdA family antitoxin [Acidimicrobiia bacterium]
MARVNVYLPDELAEQAKAASLNVSALTQEAVRSALQVQQVNEWLEEQMSRPRSDIDPRAIEEALQGAKDEIEGLDRPHWDELLERMRAEREAKGA